MFHQQRRQESIFAEGEQVLLVQGVYVIIRIFINHTVGNDERSAFIISAHAVKGEATRKTRDRAEKTLESFGQVVRDVVLVDLRVY